MDKKIKIDFDFKKIMDGMNNFFSRALPNYFKGIDMYMQIAWGFLGLGIVLIIVGLILL